MCSCLWSESTQFWYSVCLLNYHVREMKKDQGEKNPELVTLVDKLQGKEGVER